MNLLEASLHLFEDQKSAWIEEQHQIAARVEILPDAVPLYCSSSESSSVADAVADESDRFLQIDMNARVVAGLQNSTDGNMSNISSSIYFGGVDVSFPDDDSNPAVAVYVIIEYTSMKVVYTATEYFHLTVPYIPGFLAFREIEPLERLVRAQLSTRPDVTPRAILVDGNGVLHSRRAGIACFLGVRTGIPTIGIGKTLFCEAGLTKELVARAVAESACAAVDYCYCNLVRRRQKRQQQQPLELGSRMEFAAEAAAKASSKRENEDPVLLFDRQVVRPNEGEGRTNEQVDGAIMNRGALIKELSSFCHGLAIPLRGEDTVQFVSNEEDDNRDEGESEALSSYSCRGGGGRILACALVGHGGRRLLRLDMPPLPRDVGVGCQNPIFVSVGHKLSLQQAVTICASLSLARIPEPVRQADLLGRELLREAASRSWAYESLSG